MKAPILYGDGDEEIELPWRWEICDDCEGHGTSSAYLGAFTAEQMREDPEFAEDYKAGHYDRPCEHCDGTGKIKAPDEDRIPAEQLDRYLKQQRSLAEIDHIQRQEMLMEGGWREEGWFD